MQSEQAPVKEVKEGELFITTQGDIDEPQGAYLVLKGFVLNDVMEAVANSIRRSGNRFKKVTHKELAFEITDTTMDQKVGT